MPSLCRPKGALSRIKLLLEINANPTLGTVAQVRQFA
jgi:hypothetical protein